MGRACSQAAFGVLLAIVVAVPLRADETTYFVPTGFGGSLGYGYGYSRVKASEAENTTAVLSMNMAAYIWEPWFITSDFGLSLGLSESESNTSSSTVARTVSGSVDMTLFPLSRFPTTVGFSISDSRQELQENPGVGGQEYQLKRFYIRQLYQAPAGWVLSGFYNQSNAEFVGRNQEAIDRSFGVQWRHRISHHDFDFDTNYFINEPADSNIEYKNANMLFSHNYYPSAEVGVNSILTYSNSDTTGDASDTQFSYEQVSSSFYWRPEHRPYFMSGSVRVFQAETGSTTRSVASNVSGNYRVTRNINMGAALTVSVSDSDGSQSTDSSQSISASYFSDAYNIGGFEYGWGLGGSVSNVVTRSDQPSVGASANTANDAQSASATFNHRLARSWMFGRNASATMGVGQGVSKSVSSTSNDSPVNISNSLSTGFNHYGFGGASTVNASISDSRSIGDTNSEFQVGSVQVGRTQEISRLSSMSGNAGFQASRSSSVTSTTSNERETRTSRAASAALSYAHARFLGVRNLMLSSQLNFPNLIKSDTNTVQTVAEWNNTLSYAVGLLQATLIGRVQETEGGERAYSITFQAIRTF